MKVDSIYEEHITVSSSFMFRARCKKCGGAPTKYFWAQLKCCNRKNIAFVRWTFARIKDRGRLAKKNYRHHQQRLLFLTMKYANQSIIGSAFSPRFFRHSKDISIEYYEAATCECQKTIWLTHMAMDSRPEINHRKGKYGSPTKLLPD